MYPDAACLILDVQLPGITGLELQEKSAAADNRVPIVFWAMAPGRIAQRPSGRARPVFLPSRSGGSIAEDHRRGDPALSRPLQSRHQACNAEWKGNTLMYQEIVGNSPAFQQVLNLVGAIAKTIR